MKLTAILAIVFGAAAVIAAPTDIEALKVTCKAVHIVYARGTNDKPADLGGSVGPGFKAAVTKSLNAKGKSLNFQPISYPAVLGGYLIGGDRGGATTMANTVTSIAKSCPSAKIFLAGYSQGAQVVHLAAAKLSTAVRNKVSAVTFGDPNRGKALPGTLQNRRRTFCNAGDKICDGLPIVTAAHENYKSSFAPAASWVASRV
ncbi:triacylglycerol lipase [Coprinopsis sp. MPI-PUGE-AT-0042]|nr:triacylglycerol lipase [Coprinopsis sp. MPI-PUGE-AT-0042]